MHATFSCVSVLPKQRGETLCTSCLWMTSNSSRRLTAHVLRSADFGSSVDEQADDVEVACLDGLHERRGAGQRACLERRAVTQQVLDDGAHARMGGQVQRRPVEVVDAVHVRAGSHQPAHRQR